MPHLSVSKLLIHVVFILSLAPGALFAQQNYKYKADLVNVANDQVFVTLQTPQIKEETIIFSFPKAIPGSYSEKDFGRFIKDFIAYDRKGKKLPIDKINNTQFRIKKASSLQKITYNVNDTWDMSHSNFVFQPGGTNIDAGKNFVINNHAFFGYFEGYKMLPFQLEFTKPATFYAATSLQVEQKSPELDVMQAENYVYLADNPILYSKPDTTSFQVGNTNINVAVYSATGKVSSKQVAGYLKPMTFALNKFLNGLPVTSYQFLYFFDDPSKSISNSEGGWGALEHNYSSLYYLPEIGMESRLRSMVNEVSSHEFLHIQTPLNLHSEEIENFDYIQPKMSQHLWLYEGVTEYFAHLAQLQSGLLSENEFMQNMRKKLKEAEEFGSFSMTEMSKKVLTEQYKSKYNSVYNKGALLAFMLDLFIRDKTNQQKDLKTVIQTLSSKYGPGKPFKDDDLFAELIEASHPAVDTFINDYIIGSNDLPFEDLLATIGYEFSNAKKQSVYTIGEKMSLIFNEPTRQFVFSKVGANALQIRDNDVLVKLQNVVVDEDNLNDLWERYIQTNASQPELTMVVNRNGKEQVLSGQLYHNIVLVKNYLAPLETTTESQRKTKARFVGG